MQIVFLILAGVFSGIVGGMGMGGGTVLVPLLTLAFGFVQQISQSTNLISSIPMGIGGIFTHMKNKLIEYKYVFLLSGGIATSVVGSLVAKALNTVLLKKLFGGFLVLLAVFQIIAIIRQKRQKKL